jgi:hypothetical protein
MAAWMTAVTGRAGGEPASMADNSRKALLTGYTLNTTVPEDATLKLSTYEARLMEYHT